MSISDSPRMRARESGVRIGRYETGRYNAITDVRGVLVGHSTIVSGSGKLRRGHGPVRTGVTAICPSLGDVFNERVIGGGFVLNGAGEVSGLTQVMEWGLIETPILLTNTLSVGSCSQGLVKYMVERYPGIGIEQDVVIPLVGECDDSFLNDIGGRHVKAEHVYEAITSARSGAVEEGNIGGGTGMMTCDFAGGIGTSSRRLPAAHGGYTIGILVMSNFGRMADLRVDGVPVGSALEPECAERKRRTTFYGSIIAVLATDAPLLSHQITRLCKRVALGIGRVGSYAAHGSGEIILGFSSANTISRRTRKHTHQLTVLDDSHINRLYEATIEATEEAILNAIFVAERMEGVNGHVAPAIPLQRVREVLRAHGRLAGT